jgi:HOMODA hydrolase
MSLWTDFLGTEIRFVDTPSFGPTRIAESGRGKGETIIFLHGIGGHLEAYAKNIMPLAQDFHVVAFDFVGHGLSAKALKTFSPHLLAHQLVELMDALGIARAHLSGESLGGWVAGVFATLHPERTGRLMLNTAGGIPIVTAKGREDLQNLIALSAKTAIPDFESVLTRMRWLLHEQNWPLLTEELIKTRLSFYVQPEMAAARAAIGQFMASPAEPHFISLEQITCETLFLWTRENPIHDLAAARQAQAHVANSQLYIMAADCAHWPQFEAPDEFNHITRQFFLSGKLS